MKYKRTDVLKRIKKYTKKSTKEIFILIIMNALAIPVTLISPYFIKILIDNVMCGIQAKMFLFVMFGLIFVYIVRFVLDLIILNCSNKILNRFTYKIRYDVWRRYSRLSHYDFDKKDTGDLKMRLVDDVDCLGNFLNNQVVEYIFNALMATFAFAMSLYINYKLTLICITIIPIVFIINILIGKGIKKINERIREVNKEYYTFEHNSLQFWKEIKAQNAEKGFIDKFKEYRIILAKLGYTQIRYWFYTEIFTDIKSNYLSKVLIFLVGATLVLNRQLTMGSLVMLSEYFGLLFIGLEAVNSKRVELTINSPYYHRIFEALEFNEDNVNVNPKIISDGNIEIKEVSFKYDNDADYILQNINFKINKGDYIAIIGKSGCGKTTLIKLILNMYSTNNGNIKIDGININNISKKSLYSQIGVVMQDSYLFNISIKNNLLMSNKDASMYDLEFACQRANILEFVKSCPNGFDTIIGERGIKLSGGQKQRLVIAQVLLNNPKLIIFDEATSSLDKISEDIINQSINQIAKNTTVIVISHKPTTILRAKRIIIIENGQIVADENTETLVENEYYSKISM